MCGISCCITIQRHGENQADNDDIAAGKILKKSCPVCRFSQRDKVLMTKLLRNRGPDVSSATTLQEDIDTDSRVTLHFSGDVLWTQGSQPVQQPYSNASQTDFLLFNGDLYNASTCQLETEIVGKFHDGLHLFHCLEKCVTKLEVLQTFSLLEGPLAFIYYRRSTNEIWFGRDFFGRQSLLVSYPEVDDIQCPDSITISSVSIYQNVFEVPAYGIYLYNVKSQKVTAFPWESHSRDQIIKNIGNFKEFLSRRNLILKVDTVKTLKCISTILKPLPPDTSSHPILQKLKDLSCFSPEKVLFEAAQILKPDITQFLGHLRAAVEKRVIVQPPYCKTCVIQRNPCTHSRIGVLFSGGIDSTVMAHLVAECLLPGDSMDLLNVAFYHDDNLEGKIPDRETGVASFELLRSKFPEISIRFIRVDVTKSEVETWRHDRIRHLISPLTSVLDDSIGCCLWFAVRGMNGNSTARVLLVGSGADELLGGYSRHRSAFQNGGWELLQQELQLDIDRISVRNLGRDNRVLSDHGVAPRMPFLDEGVVKYLTTECDLWVKCCPLSGFTRGVGEKLLLRATALTLLGDEAIKIALYPKRAMQFGSRIAKLENSKERGNDSCRRLVENTE